MASSFGKGAQTHGQVQIFMFQDQSENESNLKRRKKKPKPMKENIFDFPLFIAHFIHSAQAYASFSMFLYLFCIQV